MPVARIGDMTLIGGPILSGSPGVLAGFPSGKPCSPAANLLSIGSPVNPAIGAKVLVNEVDLSLPCELPFTLARSYSSYKTATPSAVGILGPAWKSPLDVSLTVKNREIILHDQEGRSIYFEQLIEGSSLFSPSENIWLLRGGKEELIGGNPALGNIWKQIPLEYRLDRNSYFVMNNVLGPISIYHYPHQNHQDETAIYPQPVAEKRHLVMTVDIFGNRVHYEREKEGEQLITQITDSAGRVFRLEYEQLFKKNFNNAHKNGYGEDSGWRLMALFLENDPLFDLLPKKALVEYRYTSKGELSAVIDRSGKECREFTYDPHHIARMVGHNYSGRPMTTYRYDAAGKVIEQHNPEGLSYYFSYGTDEAIVKDNLDRVDHYFFAGEKGLRRVVKHIRKDGTIVENKFDHNGRLIAQIDALGRRKSFDLDVASGKVVGKTTDDGQEYRYDYNSMGLVVRTKTPSEEITEYHYDDYGRLIEEVNHLDEKISYQYGKNSARLAKKINPLGQATSYEWNLYGQKIAETTAEGHTTRFNYDQWGNVEEIRYEEGVLEKNRYDARNRLIESSTQTQATTYYRYNDAGDLIRLTYADGSYKTMEYNSQGLMIKSEYADQIQKYHYDSAGRMVKFINENSAEAFFEYDVMDRLIKEVGVDQREKYYLYNEVGLLTEEREQELLVTYHYNHQDQLVKKEYQDPDVGAETIKYDYQTGRLHSCEKLVDDEVVGVRFGYDALGRIAKETQWVNQGKERVWQYEISHRYNALGVREASKIEGLPEHLYEVDSEKYLTALRFGARALLAIDRDALYREKHRQFGQYILRSEYDKAGHLAKNIAEDHALTILNRHYQYDVKGQLIQTLTNSGETQYHYDVTGRLDNVISNNYTREYHYDKAGNRLPNVAHPLYPQFTENRLMEDELYFYHYDHFGNLIKKEHRFDDENHQYFYNCAQQLVRFEKYVGTDKVKETHFRYDGFGRRISKEISNFCDREFINETHYWYGWDQEKLVTIEHDEERIHTLYNPASLEPLIRIAQPLPLPEKVETLSELISSGVEVELPDLIKDRFDRVEREIRAGALSGEMAEWLADMGFDEQSIKAFLPDIPENSQVTMHYYQCDPSGTPFALINENGVIEWEIELDPLGNKIREENEKKLYQPLRLVGQFYDGDSGLHYSLNRYYDPMNGRYISQAPRTPELTTVNPYLAH